MRPPLQMRSSFPSCGAGASLTAVITRLCRLRSLSAGLRERMPPCLQTRKVSRSIADHPGIVKVLDCFIESGHLHIVKELAARGSLLSVMNVCKAAGNHLPEQTICRMAYDMSEVSDACPIRFVHSGTEFACLPCGDSASDRLVPWQGCPVVVTGLDEGVPLSVTTPCPAFLACRPT